MCAHTIVHLGLPRTSMAGQRRVAITNMLRQVLPLAQTIKAERRPPCLDKRSRLLQPFSPNMFLDSAATPCERRMSIGDGANPNRSNRPWWACDRMSSQNRPGAFPNTAIRSAAIALNREAPLCTHGHWSLREPPRARDDQCGGNGYAEQASGAKAGILGMTRHVAMFVVGACNVPRTSSRVLDLGT